jgi:hypothetical protein
MRNYGLLLGIALILVGIGFIAAQSGRSHNDLAPQVTSDNALDVSTPARPARDIREIRSRTSHPESESIEAYIATLSPRSSEVFHDSVFTYVVVIAPDMAPVDAARLFLKDESYLIELLLEHSEMTKAYAGIDIEIIDLRKNGDNFTVSYRQKIDGHLVDSISRLKFHESGKVDRLYSSIVNPNAIESGPTIREGEAIAHAKRALGIELGRDQSDALIFPISRLPNAGSPPTVYYMLQDSDMPPVPYWHIYLVPANGGVSFTARVNAMTGETTIHSNMTQ